MPTAQPPLYAVIRSDVVEWNKFASENDWASQALEQFQDQDEEWPESCQGIYYMIDKVEKKIIEKVFSLTWLSIPSHAKAFRDLNWAWVERLFKIEESDIKQLEKPVESIIKPGGEIFFCQSGKELVGTVAMVHEHGDYELAKMSVADAYQGRGLSHVLMHSTTMWAKKHKIPGVTILSSQSLVNAIALYKKHGYETVRLGSHPNYARCDIIMRLNLEN
ncbi:hypothetical protein NQZ79_g7372 [Umbelopsis isabellina]|nr:hypothetical protein NQZ79_g7372 [Umbelopsis isabellina]